MSLNDAGWIIFALGFAAFAGGYAIVFATFALAQLRDPDVVGTALSFSRGRRRALADRATQATGTAAATGTTSRTSRASRLADRLQRAGTLLLALAALVFLAGWMLP